jgi:hypothetical protein
MADQEFARTARRPVPVVEDPILQWASGLPTVNRQIYAGWLLEAGKHDDLDLAMQETGFPQVTIKHGNGAVVTHWAIETANAFVIADGVQSPQEMRQTTDRYGVAYGWRTTDTGRRQSVLKARILLRELLMLGYCDPLTLTVKSTFTDDVIRALSAQYEVLDAIDAFRALDGKPKMNPPFYACHIPLGPGADVERGRDNQKKTVSPIVENIARPITKDYIKATWIKHDWTAIIEALIDPTITWAVAESARIADGAPQANDYRARETEESLI